MKTVDLRQLTPDPRNARRHTPRNIGSIQQALREVGAGRSIVIDELGAVLAGNATIEAALKEGIDRALIIEADGRTLIAVRRRGLSDREKRRLALFDNRAAEQAEWDTDVLGALLAEQPDLADGLWSTEELAELLGMRPPGAPDPEWVPEPPATPVSKPGDIWILGGHRIICGSSTDPGTVACLLAGAAPHLMVTDPPYGVEYDAAWRNRALKHSPGLAAGKVLNDHIADWSPAWQLFPGDVAYVWHAGIHAGEVQRSLEQAEFGIRSQIIWRKSAFVIGRGHYHWQHEPCWYAVRAKKSGWWKGGRTQSTVWDIGKAPTSELGLAQTPVECLARPARGTSYRWQDESCWEGDRAQTTVWSIDKPQKSETGHSTQKPVECMARPIRNHSAPGAAVYEPFSGSGTTIVACEEMGRRCFAIELNPAYVDVAVLRWEALTGKKAELERRGGN